MPSKMHNDRWRARAFIKVPGSPGVYRERTKVFDLKRDALAWEVANRRKPVDLGRTITLATLLDLHRSDIVYGLSAGSRAVFAANVNQRLLPWFGDTVLADITPLELQRAQAAWAETGSAPTTIRNTRGTLARIFRHAALIGITEKNPVTEVAAPRGQSARTVPAYAEMELAALLSRIDSVALRCYAHTAARTGLRPAELSALSPDAVDLSAKRITVCRAYSGSGRQRELTSTKNRCTRTVPIALDLVNDLRQLRDTAEGDFLFLDERAEPVNHQLYLRRHGWTRLSRGRDFYDLRATAIVTWLRAGIPVHVVRDWAGHSTLSVTSRYARAAGTDDADAAAALDSYIARTGGSDAA
ncbi:tyrosine-type recombinase/integrase [Tsukamurella sp. PLM1]|uniref:tyrosine-type recombinase/integrase n=1 Tax=Tsukamurella sp. PLM1 TaxID=2929795 RepID=UPI002050A5AE|nr:tyrosine-type recombinase/integrase [Tsukamurella sp. PLM1]BDH56691.1 hypothetical protein MTP03_16300 [Tsukamurella sp. PLM1]